MKNKTDLKYNSFSREDLISLLGFREEQIRKFMELCTTDFGNLNYTPEAIEFMVREKQDQDLKEWCTTVVEDAATLSEGMIQFSREYEFTYNGHIVENVEKLADY